MTNSEKVSKTEGNKIYEVGYLLLPNMDENKALDEVSKIKDVLENNGAEFISEGVPEMKNLAYTMIQSSNGKNQKFNNAYFGWIKFEGKSENIQEVKKQLDAIGSILRYLLVSTARETSTIPPVRTGKFSFGETKPSESSEEEGKKESSASAESSSSSDQEEKDRDKKKEDTKELDETIDDLVIE